MTKDEKVFVHNYFIARNEINDQLNILIEKKMIDYINAENIFNDILFEIINDLHTTSYIDQNIKVIVSDSIFNTIINRIISIRDEDNEGDEIKWQLLMQSKKSIF